MKKETKDELKTALHWFMRAFELEDNPGLASTTQAQFSLMRRIKKDLEALTK